MAPGPNGLKAKTWMAPMIINEQLAKVFTLCLQEGKFPSKWKTAKLVLIPKGAGDGNEIMARPICLLDEDGKIFERVIAGRILN